MDLVDLGGRLGATGPLGSYIGLASYVGFTTTPAGTSGVDGLTE